MSPFNTSSNFNQTILRIIWKIVLANVLVITCGQLDQRVLDISPVILSSIFVFALVSEYNIDRGKRPNMHGLLNAIKDAAKCIWIAAEFGLAVFALLTLMVYAGIYEHVVALFAGMLPFVTLAIGAIYYAWRDRRPLLPIASKTK